MEEHLRRRLVHLLLLLLHFLPFSSAAFNPADNYLLNCGSTSAANFSDGSDLRSFSPDSSPPDSISLSFDGSNPLTNPNPSPSDATLYQTARIFSLTSSYTFTITQKGPHLLRLHFYPFSSPSHNLSSAVFNVSASGSTLLSGFSTSTTTSINNNNKPLVLKEFFLSINISSLSVLFSPSSPSSFAFVSAIELFSAPPQLIPDSAAPDHITAPGTPTFDGLSAQLLETIYRINAGGKKITPNNDSLWRTWVPDDEFLETKTLAMPFNFNNQITYPGGLATVEVAPNSVYGSVREMNRSSTNSTIASGNFNLTWGFPVSSGARYLVRLHFCDIVSKALNQLYFSSYINGNLASKDLDLSSALLALATPYYIDFVIDTGASPLVRLGVAPSNLSLPSTNAILNGLEIMKMNGALSLTAPPSKGKKANLALIVGAVVGGLVLIAVILFIAIFLQRKKEKSKPEKKPSEASVWSPLPTTYRGTFDSFMTERTSGSPLPNLNLELKIPFADILLATKDFDQDCEIGSGGFGKVYRGVLPDGRKIAAKRGSRGAGQGLAEFYTEIMVLSKIRHRHLVSLIGYCEEQSEMILVYEFMEKGTLKDHLYGSGLPCLSWKQRLKICIGSARGLHYLHTGAGPQGIIHRDVKSANILLDENFVAKVADFGLSKLGPLINQTHVSTTVKGSFGYFDPEYFRTQQLTDKSDVYSYGVVLLEVLSARRAIDRSLPYEQQSLAEWGMVCQKRGQLEQIVDPLLEDNINPNSLRKFGETIEKCLQPYGVDRPTMGDVLWNLEYALKLQETTMHREPFEDSVTGSSVASILVQRASSSDTNDGRGTARADSIYAGSEVTTSQVFSQLMSSDGR